MKESEMMSMLLSPLIDEMGSARAGEALDTAKPVLTAINGLLSDVSTNGKDLAAAKKALDGIHVVELWCKGIREVGDKAAAEKETK